MNVGCDDKEMRENNKESGSWEETEMTVGLWENKPIKEKVK